MEPLTVLRPEFSALGNPAVDKLCPIFGNESHFSNLKKTVFNANAVLCEAETKKELTGVEKTLIEELKDAVYQADDLVDEFLTLAEQNKKMRLFFSCSNPVLGGPASKISKVISVIEEKLEKLSLLVKHPRSEYIPEPLGLRRVGKYSGQDARCIIGREEDLKNIVDLLLDSGVETHVSFLSIVGSSGVGKTALAQLVYNDPLIKSTFPVRKWACGSYGDQSHMDVNAILGDIVGPKYEGGFTMDQLKRHLQEELAHRRYLLVLDDVQVESLDQWSKLESCLIRGERGSRVLITTRSYVSAGIIGDGKYYTLQSLSEENSWRLFEQIAYGLDKENPPVDLIDIGRRIAHRYVGSPLALRVSASLLFGQDKRIWQLVHHHIIQSYEENTIMPVLKLSYYNLESPLKCCFSYCTLFPKSRPIEKETLMSLWIAQGYVVPLDASQTLEDAAEEYFYVLLQRCFFQDIQYDEFGNVYSCKINDLMHDQGIKIRFR